MPLLSTRLNSPQLAVTVAERSPGYWQNVLHRLSRDKVAMAAAAVIVILLLLAVLGAWITPADPYKSSMLSRLKPIGTPNFPLGTDELGRDMLSRLMVGARLSLFMGITPVICAFFCGSIIGITAGYAGGAINSVIMRTIDVFYAFPSVLLAIALGRGHYQFADLIDRGVHPAHCPDRRKCDHPNSNTGLC